MLEIVMLIQVSLYMRGTVADLDIYLHVNPRFPAIAIWGDWIITKIIVSNPSPSMIIKSGSGWTIWGQMCVTAGTKRPTSVIATNQANLEGY